VEGVDLLRGADAAAPAEDLDVGASPPPELVDQVPEVLRVTALVPASGFAAPSAWRKNGTQSRMAARPSPVTRGSFAVYTRS
jgi:hypothetical protein